MNRWSYLWKIAERDLARIWLKNAHRTAVLHSLEPMKLMSVQVEISWAIKFGLLKKQKISIRCRNQRVTHFCVVFLLCC